MIDNILLHPESVTLLQDASRQLQDMQLDAAGMKRRIAELLDSQVCLLVPAALQQSQLHSACLLCIASAAFVQLLQSCLYLHDASWMLLCDMLSVHS